VASGEDDLGGRVLCLTPGRNFKVDLRYAGLDVLLNVMERTMSLPPNSAWELRRLWEGLEGRRALSIRALRTELAASRVNEYVKDALLRRLDVLDSSGLFTEMDGSKTSFEGHLLKPGGAALVFNLHSLPRSFKSLIVELVLSKVTALLESKALPALFLFAEEAHIYQERTFWEDIVTRMRHLGISPFFITNEPQSISDTVYRQADNVFLLNFANENDVAAVSRASRIDVETIALMAKSLPVHHCLAFGKVTQDFPIVMMVEGTKYFRAADTRRFWGRAEAGQRRLLSVAT